jgi:acyl carrier protein
MSSVDEIDSRVRKLVAEFLGVDEKVVKPEARITEDLEADSLDVVEMVMLIEEEFNFDITDDEAENVITVRDAIDLVRGRSK